MLGQRKGVWLAVVSGLFLGLFAAPMHADEYDDLRLKFKDTLTGGGAAARCHYQERYSNRRRP